MVNTMKLFLKQKVRIESKRTEQESEIKADESALDETWFSLNNG